MVSERLKRELLHARASGVRQYAIALRAGVHPTVLSALINASIPVRDGDLRVVAVGAVLGLTPDECFSPDQQLS